MTALVLKIAQKKNKKKYFKKYKIIHIIKIFNNKIRKIIVNWKRSQQFKISMIIYIQIINLLAH